MQPTCNTLIVGDTHQDDPANHSCANAPSAGAGRHTAIESRTVWNWCCTFVARGRCCSVSATDWRRFGCPGARPGGRTAQSPRRGGGRQVCRSVGAGGPARCVSGAASRLRHAAARRSTAAGSSDETGSVAEIPPVQQIGAATSPLLSTAQRCLRPDSCSLTMLDGAPAQSSGRRGRRRSVRQRATKTPRKLCFRRRRRCPLRAAPHRPTWISAEVNSPSHNGDSVDRVIAGSPWLNPRSAVGHAYP
jgi:hypothetical protein